MKTGTNLRRLITTILQIFFALLLITYLIVNTVVDVIRYKLTYTTISYENADSLPPPSFSLCSSNVNYNFNCTTYGNTSVNCPGLIKFVNVTNDVTYNEWFSRCYVFQTTSPLLLARPTVPTGQWTDFQSAFFIRYSFNVSYSKMKLMLWNPFDLPSSFSSATVLSTKTTPQILDPYSLSEYEACKEQVYTFYYRKHVFLNGTEKWNLDYRAEPGVSSHAFGNKNGTVGVIHLKPGSFQVQTTRDQFLLPEVSLFTNFVVLAAVLYTTYYALLGGRGKYRMTGLAHTITRYFPQQHLERPSNNFQTTNPTAEDILKAYFSGISKVRFEK